eukprot:scaffold117771_cov23-Prasinocladus_malaysianus.AAC.1
MVIFVRYEVSVSTALEKQMQASISGMAEAMSEQEELLGTAVLSLERAAQQSADLQTERRWAGGRKLSI